MRHLPRITLIMAVAALIAGCAGPDTGEPPDDDDPGRPARPDTTITLSIQDGQIQVDPDSVTVARGRVVRWSASEAEDVWIVAFGEDTPFRNGRRVFNGGGGPGNPAQGPIGSDVPTVSYKYWVFYPDGRGGYLQLDPKLVVIEDDGGDSDTLSDGEN